MIPLPREIDHHPSRLFNNHKPLLLMTNDKSKISTQSLLSNSDISPAYNSSTQPDDSFQNKPSHFCPPLQIPPSLPSLHTILVTETNAMSVLCFNLYFIMCHRYRHTSLRILYIYTRIPFTNKSVDLSLQHYQILPQSLLSGRIFNRKGHFHMII